MSTSTSTEQTVEQELMEMENRYWQAIKDKDVDEAISLTDFPCLVAGASGVATVDREKFTQIMSGARYTLNRFELLDGAEVRLLTPSVALVAYRVREDLTVDGKPVTMEAADASVWIRRGGRWLCALHTESLKGDPYGRDRKVAS